MKKILTVLLALILLFLLTIACVGCNSNDSTPTCQHTTNIGTCQKCGIFQNQSNYNKIKNKLSEASTLIEIVLKSMPSNSNNDGEYNQKLFNAFKNTQPQIENARKCLSDAIQLCSNYSELSTISSSLRRAKTALPTKVNSSSSNDLQQYLNGLRTFITEISSARTQLVYIK